MECQKDLDLLPSSILYRLYSSEYINGTSHETKGSFVPPILHPQPLVFTCGCDPHQPGGSAGAARCSSTLEARAGEVQRHKACHSLSHADGPHALYGLCYRKPQNALTVTDHKCIQYSIYHGLLTQTGRHKQNPHETCSLGKHGGMEQRGSFYGDVIDGSLLEADPRGPQASG